MERNSHPRPRALSSGTGSNLNNMIRNFSRNNSGVKSSTNAAAINPGLNSNNNNRSTYINRTQSDDVPVVENMSKSMGNSFIMSLRDRGSDEQTRDEIIIRHAGYLLKRSNFPYTMTSSSVVVATGDVKTSNGSPSVREPPLIENIIRDFPLPDLNQVAVGVDAPLQESVEEILDDIENSKTLDEGGEVIDVNGHSTILSSEDTCFCSPIIEYFETLFGKRKPNAILLESKTAETTEIPPPSTFPISVAPTPPLPIVPSLAPTASYSGAQCSTLSYNMPLKAPARSTPVPISPQVSRPAPQLQQRVGSSSSTSLRNLPRSYSNGSKLGGNANGVFANNDENHMYKKEKTDYPPPPADYLDPKDGHIWRAKYCVLEDGILYFYRNAEEGESDLAQDERNESKFESLDAMEGTGFDYESYTNSPKRFTNGTAAAAGMEFSGRSSIRYSRQFSSTQDLHDLSKSPMTYKKSDILEYATRRSSSNLSEMHGRAQLHHSNSTNTFNTDSEILWEKRVALDCVGAVRSSEQDHGDHAFELLAFGMEGHTDEMSNSVDEMGQHEIVDRLILRAGSSDDMNDWMFQFHRSLTSYMRKIVQQHNNLRPDSPIMHRRPTPIHSGKGSALSPFGTKQSLSPTTNSFGGSLTKQNFPSLSHGHGRNALYRRQVRDGENDGLISPVSTPGGGSSPLDDTKPMVPSLQSKILSKGETEAAPMIPKDDTLAPKKYIPPHLRKNESGPKKYVPPHLRKKAQPAEAKDSATDVPVQPPPLVYEEPLIDDGVKDTSDQGNDSYSGSATSSLLSMQMDDSESVSLTVNIRLGGCADPAAVVGSILDHHYINRKASVVDNTRLDAYGGRGGGLFERNTNVEDHSSISSVLKWEVGAASECGVRNSNEDSYVAINNLDEMIKSQGLVSFADQDFGETKQQGLYAIFDGHVGNQAARFGAEKFPDILIEEQSSLASRDSARMTSIETRTDSIMRNAFHRLDKEFCNLCTRDGRDWDSGSTALVALIVDDVVTLANLGDCRGVVCRIVSSESDELNLDGWENLDEDTEKDEKWEKTRVAGVKRSELRLFWKEMTETHSPLLSDERARIEKANGWIVRETEIPTGQLHRMDFFDKDVIEIVKRCFADRLKQHRSDPVRQIQIARTCGDLAVSRAIGDRDFKAAYNMPPTSNNNSSLISVEERSELSISWEGPPVFIYPEGHSGRFKGDLVSHEPDIKFFKVGQKGVADEFLLMACDGLWDVMDGDDAVRIAKDLLFDKNLSAKDGAARLAELAKHLGSSDNITVVLIKFYWESGGKT